MTMTNDAVLLSEVERLRAQVAQLERRLADQQSEDYSGQQEFQTILHAITENTPDVIYMKDRKGRYLLANSSTAELIGLPVDQIIGKTDAEIFPSETADELIEHDSQVITTQKPKVYEEKIPKNGVLHTYLITSTVCQNDQGKVIGILGIARDITERKRAERALAEAHAELEQQVADQTREIRESHERFRVIAEAIPIPVVITGESDGQILYANARAAEEFGGPKKELVGRKSLEFYQDPKARQALLDELEKAGSVKGFELSIRVDDGQLRWVSVWLQPITFDGQASVLAGFLDITNRKQDEERLESDRRLLRRLLDLHERERQLTAYEIHDGMVQDMTAAVMFLEAHAEQISAQNEISRTHLERAIRLIQDNIDEARRLINGLQPPILEDCGVIPAVENLIEEVRATSGLEVVFEHLIDFDRIAPALEKAIYRIVQESLNNVWQHSKSDFAKVQLVQSNQWLKICVTDHGTGFDAKKQDNRKYGLRGIRERARLLGGSAEIKSVFGKGTRVLVSLPLNDVLLPSADGV